MNRYLRRALCLVFCAVMILCVLPGVSAEEANGGSYGNGLSWALAADGTLTISGTGTMQYQYQQESYPWYSAREKITAVQVEEGVTSIAAYAFADSPNLARVSIAGTVESIDGRAFLNCAALREVTLEEGLKSIELCAFSGCPIEQIAIPETVTYIGGEAFRNGALTELALPDSVANIGSEAFRGCSGLKQVTLSGSWVD